MSGEREREARARLDELLARAAAEPAPDLTGRVLAAEAARRRRAARRTGALTRCAVGMAGAVQLVAALLVLVSMNSHGHAHTARDLAAYEAALGMGLLAVAWRPQWARGLLPMIALLGAVGGLSALADLVTGAGTPADVLLHSLPLWVLPLVWRMARAAAGQAMGRAVARDGRAIRRAGA